MLTFKCPTPPHGGQDWFELRVSKCSPGLLRSLPKSGRLRKVPYPSDLGNEKNSPFRRLTTLVT